MKNILAALLVLAIASCCFGVSFGPSVIRVERTWTVVSGGAYSFDGALAVNDSNQRVLSIETDPPMHVSSDRDGNIRVQYNGSAGTLRAVAVVAVDYNSNVLSDPPLARNGPLNATKLTQWNQGIAASADGLAADGTLETIRNITNFVHGYITYNISYFGRVLNATDVYAVRQGVCVEYSHLTISMARHLGLDTRFVSGFVNGGEWQPHAWVEIKVPGYGWLPVDSTFGEAGMLDDSHVAGEKGADQSAIFDSVRSSGNDALQLSTDWSAEFINQSSDPKGRSLSFAFDAQGHALNITLENTRDDYVFGAYQAQLSGVPGVNDSAVVLLAPHESATRSYGLDFSALRPGYDYTLPAAATLDDASASENLTVEVPAAPAPGTDGNGEPAQACPAACLLFGLLILYPSRQ
jgi:transglutaminase-like putative cysteine protease